MPAHQDTEARQAYMAWLETPREEREPRSENAFAKSIGTPRQTLNRWRNDWRFVAEVQGRLGRHIDIGIIPDVVKTLVTQATDPSSTRSVTAARTLLDWLKWNIERSEDLNSPDIKNLSDDELRDLMLAALDVIDERERHEQTLNMP